MCLLTTWLGRSLLPGSPLHLEHPTHVPWAGLAPGLGGTQGQPGAQVPPDRGWLLLAGHRVSPGGCHCHCPSLTGNRR